jgi:DNA polymerase-3 subunit epsilon
MPSEKLEILNLFHGFFVRSHRALADADALLHLLTFPAPGREAAYLAELLAAARQPLVRVWAKDAPYEAKDLLRERGYRWQPERRTWMRECGPKEAEQEQAWLAEVVYPGRGAPKLERISPFDRFKEAR